MWPTLSSVLLCSPYFTFFLTRCQHVLLTQLSRVKTYQVGLTPDGACQ